MNSTAERGFTLIELMIVVVIVAILLAMALPAYDAYTRKAQRKVAMAALQGLSQAMERFYAGQNTYAGADSGGTPTIFPSKSPIDGGTPTYTLTITNASTTGYTLTATPIGSQAKDGKLQLDSTGARAWDKDNNGSYSASEQTWNDH